MNNKISSYIFIFPLYVLLIMWGVFLIEHIFSIDLYRYGILSRQISGLKGIVCSPFLHGDLNHIFSNSVPLYVMMVLLLYFYKNTAWKVLLFGTLVTGILVWGMSRGDTYHIGASGVVYLLFGYLFFGGLFRGSFVLITVSLLVVFLYGGMVWGVLPLYRGISWESHLFGTMTGIFFAYLYKDNMIVDKKFDWEDPNYIDEYEEAYWEIDNEEIIHTNEDNNI